MVRVGGCPEQSASRARMVLLELRARTELRAIPEEMGRKADAAAPVLPVVMVITAAAVAGVA